MLPGELQATVQEAEELAGCEIAVVPDKAASEFDNLTLGFDFGAGACTATIAYRGNAITPCALVHEVLHVKRYWVDEVPIIKPAAQRFALESQALEDLLEHLVIIPEEQHYVREESNAHWSSVMAAKLAELPRVSPRPSQAEVVALKRSLLLQRAMMDIALPDLDRTGLYDRLRDENLLEASTAFVDGLRTLLSDKQRALSFVGQEFRHEQAGFWVGRFNLRATPKSFGAP
jgi:hypothetical protein